MLRASSSAFGKIYIPRRKDFYFFSCELCNIAYLRFKTIWVLKKWDAMLIHLEQSKKYEHDTKDNIFSHYQLFLKYLDGLRLIIPAFGPLLRHTRRNPTNWAEMETAGGRVKGGWQTCSVWWGKDRPICIKHDRLREIQEFRISQPNDPERKSGKFAIDLVSKKLIVIFESFEN